MQSMTGFGRGEARRQGVRLNAQISAVNHRSCDIRFAMPRELSPCEKVLRDRIRENVQRGSLQVSVELICEEAASSRLRLDLQLARDLQRQANQVRNELGLTGEIALRDLLVVPEMLIVEKTQLPEDLLEALAAEAIAEALKGLIAMRQAEGESLYTDLTARLAEIARGVAQISELAPRVPIQYRERLEQRLAELLHDNDLDQERLMKEVAWFADKADISEELTRLQSHVEQLGLLMQSEESIGRKVDFFLQEMNREVNTIGSKANDQSIAQHVVDLKAEIERMREQANNVQ